MWVSIIVEIFPPDACLNAITSIGIDRLQANHVGHF